MPSSPPGPRAQMVRPLYQGQVVLTVQTYNRPFVQFHQPPQTHAFPLTFDFAAGQIASKNAAISTPAVNASSGSA